VNMQGHDRSSQSSRACSASRWSSAAPDGVWPLSIQLIAGVLLLVFAGLRW
jgi:hypothetical protein